MKSGKWVTSLIGFYFRRYRTNLLMNVCTWWPHSKQEMESFELIRKIHGLMWNAFVELAEKKELKLIGEKKLFLITAWKWISLIFRILGLVHDWCPCRGRLDTLVLSCDNFIQKSHLSSYRHHSRTTPRNDVETWSAIGLTFPEKTEPTFVLKFKKWEPNCWCISILFHIQYFINSNRQMQ